MAAKQSSYEQELSEIFDPSQPITNSRLVHLSNLDDRGLELLKRAWANSDAERRRKVIASLVHLSETDLKLNFSRTFAFCLHDPDETVKTQAIAGLEAGEDPIIVAPLLETLKHDTSANVRAAAATALGTFALLGELGELSAYYVDKVYTALLAVLDNMGEPVEMRRRALEAIAPLNLPRVKEHIEKAYQSNDIKLKASAIYAMGRNCDPVWLTILLAELDSQETEIRYEAATACGELGAEEAVPYLIKLTKDADRQVQEAAMKALGEIGGEEAKQTLNKLSKSPQPRIRDTARSALTELQFCEGPLSLNF
jgi:HEAT repeat protein